MFHSLYTSDPFIAFHVCHVVHLCPARFSKSSTFLSLSLSIGGSLSGRRSTVACCLAYIRRSVRPLLSGCYTANATVRPVVLSPLLRSFSVIVLCDCPSIAPLPLVQSSVRTRLRLLLCRCSVVFVFRLIRPLWLLQLMFVVFESELTGCPAVSSSIVRKSVRLLSGLWSIPVVISSSLSLFSPSGCLSGHRSICPVCLSLFGGVCPVHVWCIQSCLFKAVRFSGCRQFLYHHRYFGHMSGSFRLIVWFDCISILVGSFLSVHVRLPRSILFMS